MSITDGGIIDAGDGADGIDNGASAGISGIEIGKPFTVDPTTASNSTANVGSDPGNGRRTRSDAGKSRKPYTRKSTGTAAPASGEEKTLRVDVLTGILLSLHTMAAVKIPEMEMSQSEAEAIAKAYTHVAEFYPVLQQTAKAAAWTELLSVLGMTYGMRLVAMRNNAANKKKAARNMSAPGTENVIDMTGLTRPQV